MKIKELGHIVLYVTNLEKNVTFYRDILGFHEIASQPGMTMFSSGRTHHELLLLEVGGTPRRRSSGQAKQAGRIEPGLYHIGLKIGDTDDELRSAIEELKRARIPILGSADHTVSKGVYITDPDGNEIELYIDASDEWKRNPQLILSPPKPLQL